MQERQIFMFMGTDGLSDVTRTKAESVLKRNKAELYSHPPHNDVSVNDVPHMDGGPIIL